MSTRRTVMVKSLSGIPRKYANFMQVVTDE
jgi:hypothetical protein